MTYLLLNSNRLLSPFSRIFLFTSIFILLMIACPLFLDAQKASRSDSLPKTLVALSTLEIPDFTQSAQDLVRQAENVIKKESFPLEAVEGINELQSQLSQKIRDFKNEEIVYRLDLLEEDEIALNSYAKNLNKWKLEIADWLASAEPISGQIDTSILILEVTFDSLQSDSSFLAENEVVANSDLTQEDSTLTRLEVSIDTTIQANIHDLRNTKNQLDKRIFEIKQTANRITNAINDIEEANELILERRKEVIEKIWIPEYPPIWQVKKDTLAQKNATNSIEQINNSYLNSITQYLTDTPSFIYQAIFSFFVIISLLLYLNRQSSTYYASFQEELKEAYVLLRHPVPATFILMCFWLTVSFDLSKEMKTTVGLLILFPLSYMLWLLWDKQKLYRVIFFVCTYLVFILMTVLNNFPIFQRYILLAVDIIAIIILFRLQKDESIREEKFWVDYLIYLIRTFFIISIVAALANIFGMVQLSYILTNTILGTFVYFTIIMEVIFLIRSLIFLIILGPLYQKSNIFKEDSKTILEKIDEIFKMIGNLVWLIYVLDLAKIRKSIILNLSTFLNQSLEIGDLSFTLGNILAFIIIIVFSGWITRFVLYMLDKEIYPRKKLHQDEQSTISLLTRYGIAIIGFIFALAALGIQFDQLAIALGGLGVGIGFGLQNIVNQFVSGIILILERPITIGDIVDVSGVSGIVQDIGFRSSKIRTWEGSEVIIPNGNLLSGNLTNWTLTNSNRRVMTEIRVPYDTDIQAVKEILLKTASELPEVMKNPGPYINFKGIGTSAMEVNLYCWIEDTNTIFSSGTAIRVAVYQALQQAGYDIPLPTSDINISQLTNL